MSRIGDLIIGVCEDYEKGLSIRRIARKYKIPKSFVCQILVEFYGDLVGGV